MAKRWQDVQQSDMYATLTPEQKSQAQTQYFDDVVAPQLPDGAYDTAKTQFFNQYPLPAVNDEWTGRELASSVLAPAEITSTLLTSAVAEPVAGIAGLGAALAGAVVPGKEGQAGQWGADTVNWVRDKFSYTPKTRAAKAALGTLEPVGEWIEKLEQGFGDIGFEATGDQPIGGAIASAIPAAIGEIPIFKGPKAAARALKVQAARHLDEAAEMDRLNELDRIEAEQPLQDSPPVEPELEDPVIQKTAETIKEKNVPAMIEDMQLDENFYKAAEELEIDTEPLSSYASKNKQFRSIEMGLGGIPGHVVDVRHNQYLKALDTRAEKLIDDYGGTLNKAGLSDEFRAESLKTIDDLNIEADELYGQIKELIPPSTQVSPTNATKLIQQVAADFGGIDKMPAAYKDLARSLMPEDGKVTLAAVDYFRNEVGDALNKRAGEFKDVQTGELKRIYAALKRDQEAIAFEKGGSGTQNLVTTANNLVKKRKHLEDNVKKLLGRDLSGDLMPKVGRDIRALTKGNVQKWDATMKRIPEEMRAQVVVSALGDLFGSGGRLGTLNPTKFANFYTELNKNPAAKDRIFKHLPKDARKDMDNLFKIANGVSQAMGDKIPTGRVMSFFNEQTGLVRRLVGQSAASVGGVVGGALGMPGLGATTGAAIGEMLTKTTDAAKAASELLGSPALQQAIRDAVKEGVVDGNQISRRLAAKEKSISKSKAYQKWADALDENSAAQLGAQGLLSYLLAPQPEEEQETK